MWCCCVSYDDGDFTVLSTLKQQSNKVQLIIPKSWEAICNSSDCYQTRRTRGEKALSYYLDHPSFQFAFPQGLFKETGRIDTRKTATLTPCRTQPRGWASQDPQTTTRCCSEHNSGEEISSKVWSRQIITFNHDTELQQAPTGGYFSRNPSGCRCAAQRSFWLLLSYWRTKPHVRDVFNLCALSFFHLSELKFCEWLWLLFCDYSNVIILYSTSIFIHVKPVVTCYKHNMDISLSWYTISNSSDIKGEHCFASDMYNICTDQYF